MKVLSSVIALVLSASAVNAFTAPASRAFTKQVSMDSLKKTSSRLFAEDEDDQVSIALLQVEVILFEK